MRKFLFFAVFFVLVKCNFLMANSYAWVKNIHSAEHRNKVAKDIFTNSYNNRNTNTAKLDLERDKNFTIVHSGSLDVNFRKIVNGNLLKISKKSVQSVIENKILASKKLYISSNILFPCTACKSKIKVNNRFFQKRTYDDLCFFSTLLKNQAIDKIINLSLNQSASNQSAGKNIYLNDATNNIMHEVRLTNVLQNVNYNNLL